MISKHLRRIRTQCSKNGIISITQPIIRVQLIIPTAISATHRELTLFFAMHMLVRKDLCPARSIRDCPINGLAGCVPKSCQVLSSAFAIRPSESPGGQHPCRCQASVSFECSRDVPQPFSHSNADGRRFLLSPCPRQ